jgi:hypothetical protein
MRPRKSRMVPAILLSTLSSGSGFEIAFVDMVSFRSHSSRVSLKTN